MIRSSTSRNQVVVCWSTARTVRHDCGSVPSFFTEPVATNELAISTTCGRTETGVDLLMCCQSGLFSYPNKCEECVLIFIPCAGRLKDIQLFSGQP
jgi:hypothetical protein